MSAYTVVALDDAQGPFFEAREVAFPDATAALWTETDRRDPGAVRDGGWWLRFRCFALRPAAGGPVILVDTGIGAASAPARSWAPVPGRLPEALDEAGIAPGDVDTVVLTHLHTDHIGWSIGADGTPFFPNARYLLQRAEVEAGSPVLGWLLPPLGDRLSLLDGEAVLRPGVRVVPTPGHTPGHQSVLVRDGDETVVVTGDLLVHMLQLVDPEQRYTHEVDPSLARASRTGLLSRVGPATLATPHLSKPFVTYPAP